ncbi:hypothetical protein KAFR_0A07110 [Kazachstania africana CBS 2517]|uniref:Uncharacterized protein n=1 Tax=Kazachstania africana (strain ATCC 22294 / BCRC 22015 / CBS 2517 / CECT 1963 / NBRC 1671 / NRRL Y-8276) TaxID=1071382 RepID=H2AP45_KAZAF|nr:hypothetical protein KAFR_0A07110 [Kazachstania africana CBS 2517]CCF56145.1 hypothetical protein KAFR_0A07110 [Kazachstania africana CBS 2517]
MFPNNMNYAAGQIPLGRVNSNLNESAIAMDGASHPSPFNFTPIIDESKAFERFNSRSNSSSSSSSNSIMSNSTIESMSFMDTLEYDLNPIKYKNDISKLFEDDVLYCPRSLLSSAELQKCEQFDKMLQNRFSNEQSHLSPIQQQQQQQQQQIINKNFKYNPYTSKSFNPSN